MAVPQTESVPSRESGFIRQSGMSDLQQTVKPEDKSGGFPHFNREG